MIYQSSDMLSKGVNPNYFSEKTEKKNSKNANLEKDAS